VNSTERRLLQGIVTLACAVPILGGGLGVLRGPSFLGLLVPVSVDSHFRYLSGLLLGIGCGFLSTVPRIESQGARFALLAAIVVVGGFARLLSLVAEGVPDTSMVFALAMELVVVPSLMLWQRRVARIYREAVSR
jgi:hypothetical protein